MTRTFPIAIPVAFCWAVLAARAEVPGQSLAQLRKHAAHIVVGKVTGVSASSTTKGNSMRTQFVAEIEIEGVEKGRGLKTGELVHAHYWRLSWVGKGTPPPGATDGFHPLPQPGDRVRAYLGRNTRKINNDDAYAALFPNGFEIFKAKEPAAARARDEWLARVRDDQ